MKIAAAPSPRGTNNERLFLFHCPRGSTPELARPQHPGLLRRLPLQPLGSISGDGWRDVRLPDIEAAVCVPGLRQAQRRQ